MNQEGLKLNASFENLDGIQGQIIVPEGVAGGVVQLKGKINRNYRSLMGRENQAEEGSDDDKKSEEAKSLAIMVYYYIP